MEDLFFISCWGGYIVNNPLKESARKIIYILGVAGFTLTVLLNMLYSVNQGTPQQLFYGEMRINVLLESLFVFVLVKHKFENVTPENSFTKIIGKASKYSFGIYLVHIFVLILLTRTGITPLLFNPVFSVPVISVITFFASYIISMIINKIPVIKDYIV